MCFLLSGCELTDILNDNKVTKNEIIELTGPFCVFTKEHGDKFENCNLDYWIHYWAGVDNLTWPQRVAEINNLSETVPNTFKKVLLCQGKGTPYQNRLRAQAWLISIMPAFTYEMREFVTTAVLQPSQELLELESALVTLSKINTNQSIRVEEQQELIDQKTNEIEQQINQIEEQKSQIEQLLKIEASIMSNAKGDSK
jgi:hypothetical protein